FWGKIERGHISPRLFTRAFKDILRKLFDIVISTPDSLSSFVDFENDHYDYVIFDEASQIFLEKAIPFISIADKVIIAGDDQQMQPTNWFGIRSSDSEDDDFQDSEEKIDSLLIYGIEKGLFQNLLELNYRSQAADLTTFSSKEFYDKKLKSVDKNIPLGKTIEVYDVDGI
ncbi:ATP-binding protein, partial [bacterium]|nr:ATP-binding protein [bacterium]